MKNKITDYYSSNKDFLKVISIEMIILLLSLYYAA